jgi:hypothetical protein
VHAKYHTVVCSGALFKLKPVYVSAGVGRFRGAGAAETSADEEPMAAVETPSAEHQQPATFHSHHANGSTAGEASSTRHDQFAVMQDNVLLLQDLLNQTSLAEDQARSVPGLILEFAFISIHRMCECSWSLSR